MDSFLLIKILKGVSEIALMFFLGRGMLVVFFVGAQGRLQQNFVYQLFYKATQPIVKALRVITPKFVLDRHLVWGAFFLVVIIWIAMVMAKAQACFADMSNPSCADLQRRTQSTQEAGK